jgi:hypothetical protein
MLRQDASWNSDCYRIGWHIFDDHGVGADHYVITYGDAAEDLGASSNIDSITDDGGSAETGAGQANRLDALPQDLSGVEQDDYY